MKGFLANLRIQYFLQIFAIIFIFSKNRVLRLRFKLSITLQISDLTFYDFPAKLAKLEDLKFY